MNVSFRPSVTVSWLVFTESPGPPAPAHSAESSGRSAWRLANLSQIQTSWVVRPATPPAWRLSKFYRLDRGALELVAAVGAVGEQAAGIDPVGCLMSTAGDAWPPDGRTLGAAPAQSSLRAHYERLNVFSSLRFEDLVIVLGPRTTIRIGCSLSAGTGA